MSRLVGALVNKGVKPKPGRRVAASTINHQPPIQDDKLTDDQKATWSDYIDECMNSYSAQVDPHDSGYCPQWFNNINAGSNPVAKEISWTGFPKILQTKYPDDVTRWKIADADRQGNQDEYCEWWVQKDSKGKVTSVTFTSENPEYWESIISEDRDLCLKLYAQLLGHPVDASDIYDSNGKYIPANKWNSNSQTGVIHLVQRNNTLGAEIDIAARSTLVRLNASGTPITGADALIKCSKFGNAGRHSDPHIGDEVNTLARAGYLVSLAEPVALYLKGVNFPPGTWETPDGSDPNNFWRVVRGDANHCVRAEFKVPEDKKYVVGDILLNGNPIKYGGQIADFVTVKLTGIAKDPKPSNVVGVKYCYVPHEE